MSLLRFNVASCCAAAYFFNYTRYALRKRKSVAQCCGIIGYVGSREAQPVLLNGVTILQNRGYDSCGISTVSPDGVLHTTKFASVDSESDCIELLVNTIREDHARHSIGIGHTRWATHGAKTEYNAHPHHDFKDRLSIVHNGTIVNYLELKEELKENGIPFRSETDSEVIVNLISWYLDIHDNLFKAVTLAVNRLQGTWGFALLYKDTQEEIYLARNGSPLVIGYNNDEVFLASEPSAFLHYTSQFFGLNDGEVCVVRPSGIKKLIESRSLHNLDAEDLLLTPDPYTHWTIKEIMEQPETVERALNFGGRLYPIGYKVKLGGLDQASNILFNIKHLIITGCGTSLFAGLYGELVMKSLRCFETVQIVDAAEFTVDSLPRSKHAGVLLLSQSGETLDTIRAAKIALSMSVPCFSIVNCVGSHLARLTNIGVYTNAGREVSVASTKAFTSQVIIMVLIAVWFSQREDGHRERCYELMGSLCRLPVSMALLLKDLSPIQELAERLKSYRSILIVGKGLFYPVALEGALKLKEMAYVHAEGFSIGALKHGPFALIDADEFTPVILIGSEEEHLEFYENTASQLKSRGAQVITITDNSTCLSHLSNTHIMIPKNGTFTPLLAGIVLQLLAYYIGVAKGINPDKPRCLAKTVTVS